MEWNDKNINFTWKIEPINKYDGSNYCGVRRGYRVCCGDLSTAVITEDLSKYLINLTKGLENRYTVADRNISGYKMMYQRFGIINHTEMEIYIPVLVDVKIPKGSLIYTDPASRKCRASNGIITRIWSIKDMLNMTRYPLRINQVIIVSHSQYDAGTVIPIEIVSDITSGCVCRNLVNYNKMDKDERIMTFHINENELLSIYELNTKESARREAMVKSRQTIYVGGRTSFTVDELRGHFHIWDVATYLYNSCPKYHVDDLIQIDNFDTKPVACSTGFHFFGSAAEAISYVYH